MASAGSKSSILKMVGLGLLVLIIILYFSVNQILKGSLAQLDGQVSAEQLSDQVTIERDEQGIPTLTGKSRSDLAFGLGFLHGQERFFQMDLLRRNSAGELSDLFGELAEPVDLKNRVHLFRKRATTAYNQLPIDQKALIDAYVSGVNHGLQNLENTPFEYYLVGQDPVPWRPADTFLVVYSMYMDLQHEQGEYERSLAVLKDYLPNDWFEFLKPKAVQMDGLDWEAPVTDYQYQQLAIPTSAYPDLMPLLKDKIEATKSDAVAATDMHSLFQQSKTSLFETTGLPEDEGVPGSNNWGVTGALTQSGSAMVANDMHLGIRVPNIWYRASWYLPSDGRRITGASLPGTPVMVVGSNENVSWGFTNSYGDWYDIIKIQRSDDKTQYKTPEGWKDFVVHEEKVGSQILKVEETIWGPVIGQDHHSNDLVMHWVAHSDQGANLKLLGIETANSIQDVVKVANGAGIPAQNMMVGDKQGQLAWILTGALPERPITDNEYLLDWSNTGSSWTGWVPLSEHPVAYANQERLWTANSRVVADDRYNIVGDGGYDIGIRSKLIRNRLMDKTSFDENDLLDIMLDTHNPLLDKWQSLLASTSVKMTANHPDQANAIDSIINNWTGLAEIDSKSYGLVRQYRKEVLDLVLAPIYNPLIEAFPKQFWYKTVDNHIDNPLWILVNKQPANGLNPEFENWQALLEKGALNALEKQNAGEKTWGDDSQLKVQHPLSRAVPALGSFLDMPSEPVAGDRNNVIRIQGPAFGASERMVVAPGQESKGIFHMATGQSGHPLSPFYEFGHQDWVQGKPSPFLPGETKYTLVLSPK